MAIRNNPVKIAGWLYNAGNLLLIAAPPYAWATDLLTRGPAGMLNAQISLSTALPMGAGVLLFISGIFYTRGAFVIGNRFSTVAALLLGCDLMLHDAPVGAACAVIFHAGGKAIGSFPAFFTRKFGHSRHALLRRVLGTPANASGYGPMISRAPVGIDVVRRIDPLLGIAFALWLVADFLLTRATKMEAR